jgi:hypothetical protein
MRKDNDVLRDGQLKFLLADDANGVLAYARKSGDDAAVVVINSSKQARTVHVPYDGFLPGAGADVTVDPLGSSVQFIDSDLTGPDAPTGLSATANGVAVDLHWNSVAGSTVFNLYRSPLAGGGYTKVNGPPITTTSYADHSADLVSGTTYYYIVKAVDAVGNESGSSNEVAAVPSYPISAVSLDRPLTLDYTISAAGRTDPIYGRIKIDGVTSQTGETPGILAQVCFATTLPGPAHPVCEAMTFSSDVGDEDEYSGTLKPETPGPYGYWVQFSTNQGASWTTSTGHGMLTVDANPDQTPPGAPSGLSAKSRGATSIGLSWTAPGDADLYGYIVYRSTTSGSGYVEAGRTDAATTKFTDTGLTSGTTYYYVVKALDQANNLSAASGEASGVPSGLAVDVTLVVTPPATTPDNATLYIAGNQPEICNWCNQHTTTLTKGGDGKWRVTITWAEGTSVEYKYTLGDWDHVEKGASCDEIANRKFTVAPDGDDATMTVEETVKNWRNVAPCGA